MRKAGIWIDKEQAYVITDSKQDFDLHRIPSDLEFFNPRGGSRSKTRWGPQQVVHDSKFTEREKHQLKRYFEALIPNIEKAEDLVIFGPAETKFQFMKTLEESYPNLAAKVTSVEIADSMTENQLRAWVRDYFNSN